MTGLCYRCEHRAMFLESGRQPRFECGSATSCVVGCYMYRPVNPIVIKPREGDSRPLTLDIISCRVEGVRVADLQIGVKVVDDGVLIYRKDN